MLWQADSLPLSHQGSPDMHIYIYIYIFFFFLLLLSLICVCLESLGRRDFFLVAQHTVGAQ